MIPMLAMSWLPTNRPLALLVYVLSFLAVRV
jgi:hypothetical protein